MKRATGNAFEYNDVNLIDKTFLAERFGEYYKDAYALAKAAVEDSINVSKRAKAAEAKAAEKAIKAAHKAAGGEQNWKQAVSVFNSTANDKLKAAVKTLLDNNSVEAGVDLIISTVNKSGKVPLIKPSLQGGSGIGNAEALTAEQFRTELAALRKEAGPNSLEIGHYGQKYNQLLGRRAAGKKLGY
jgi:hypothetical protein